jgi:hypothetical protein
MTNTQNEHVKDMALNIAGEYSKNQNHPTIDPLLILTLSKIIFDLVVAVKKCYDTRNTKDLSVKLENLNTIQKLVVKFIIKRHTVGTHLKSSIINDIIMSQKLTEDQLINLLGE